MQDEPSHGRNLPVCLMGTELEPQWYDDPTAETYDVVDRVSSEFMLAVEEEVPMSRRTHKRVNHRLKTLILHLLSA